MQNTQVPSSSETNSSTSGNKSEIATLAQSGTTNVFLSISNSTPWIIDSGASSHMISNRSIYSSYSPSCHSSFVVLVDDSRTNVLGEWAIYANPNLRFSSVLYVPKFPVHLLSISQLTKSLNCSVTFFLSYCVFQDLGTKKTIGGGHEMNGVYHLSTSLPSSNTAFSSAVSSEQWHYRLGHPPLRLLYHLGLPFDVNSRLDCESCQLGKHHCVSYPSQFNKVSPCLFQLVHSDLWGSCRVPNC